MLIGWVDTIGCIDIMDWSYLVVVEHGVHVLDPHRVHRAVEDDPFAVLRALVG